jgi:sugar lactone lactonase YvrE
MYDPLSGQNRAIPVPSRVGTVVPQTDSTAVVALEDGVYLLNLINEELSLISDVEADVPTNRFNDGKCDPLGNLWVGSMRLDESVPAAALYRVAPTGTTTRMLTDITISNGIVWSGDKSTMYYIDTPTGKIRAFDFDPDTAAISNERIAVEIAPELGYPDGMTIDENDHLWVALWNGNAVACFDPDSGELIGKIAVPAHNVTSCAFGGPNLDLLYITTASIDMTPQEIDNYPMAGSVFVVSPGVKGVKGTFFGRPGL